VTPAGWRRAHLVDLSREHMDARMMIDMSRRQPDAIPTIAAAHDEQTIRRAAEDVRQGDHSHASWRPSDDWCGDRQARPRSPARLWVSCP